MEERSVNISTLRQTIPRALHLVWDMAPGWTIYNIILVIILGILPLAGLYLTKLIVDSVTAGIGAPDISPVLTQVFILILIAAGVALAIAVARSVSELVSEAQSMIVTDGVSDILHAQSLTVDLEYYEETDYYDTLHRAQQEAPYRPARIVNGLVQVGQGGISLIGIAGLLIAFNWLIAVILFIAAIPAALVRFAYARKLFRFEQEKTEAERQAWYYHWVLTDSTHAKEVRLLDLGNLFRNRFRGIRTDLRNERLKLFRKRTIYDVISQAIAVGALFGIFALIAYQTLYGVITIGSLVMLYLAFQLGLGYIQTVLRAMAGLYEDNLFITTFYRFLDLKPKIQVPAHPVPVPEHPQKGVVFDNVRFSYPSGGKEVLSGVTLTLSPGKVIALVGNNGSGKTTLVKLLCRLYDPTQGIITVDGIDIRNFDPVTWRKEISVLFQDYVHYFLSARENIWVGDLRKEPDPLAIIEAAKASGADPLIRQLPRGYDTPLGHWFDKGQELSEGEWQKVALARAFFHDSAIVILDEPTSSLDPIAESELFDHFKALLKGRSALVISHRFSTVTMADYIYVLEHGHILEQGTHDDLLQMNGKYAHLFRTQARQYKEEPLGKKAGINEFDTV